MTEIGFNMPLSKDKLCLLVTLFFTAVESRDLSKEPGHMKPLGSGKLNIEVDETQQFPTSKQFFENYALPSKPLIMRGAGKLSPAFNLWTDEYFLSLSIPEDNKVSVETRKVDIPNPVVDMNFQSFVKVYNKTEQYMVSALPDFLRKDVLLPCPLQCPGLTEKSLVESLMWFNSGGHKSKLHFDAVDNINCLFRGKKEFLLIDPSKYRDKVDIDVPEAAFSNVDVERVDYTKYPGLADVEFYHAEVNAGDCFFLPFKWVHFVRSYGSNLAVNVWWNHHHNSDLNLDNCNEICDQDLKLGDSMFNGFEQIMESAGAMKDHFEGLLYVRKKLDFELLKEVWIGEDLKYLEGRGADHLYLPPLQEMFDIVDVDKDQILTMSDIGKVSKEAWIDLKEKMLAYDKNIEQILDDLGPPEGIIEAYKDKLKIENPAIDSRQEL